MSERVYQRISELYDDAVCEKAKAAEELPSPERFAKEVQRRLTEKIIHNNANTMPEKHIPIPLALPWYVVARCILAYCEFTFPIDDYLFDSRMPESRIIVLGKAKIDDEFPKSSVYFRDFKANLRKLARRFEPTLSEFDLRSIECFVEDESNHKGV